LGTSRLRRRPIRRGLSPSSFRPGAGGNTGTAAAARAAPDGYTLLGGGSGPIAANMALYKNLGYDPENELDVISPFAAFNRDAVNAIANAASDSGKNEEQRLGFFSWKVQWPPSRLHPQRTASFTSVQWGHG
jgi:hypothetical protein